MAFYTAEWVRDLVKEDHKNLLNHLNKKGNDFRSYIDSTLPFTLFLDMETIRKNILQPNAKFIEQLGDLLQLKNNQILIDELDNAYKKTINHYINNYPSIDSTELQNKLNILSSSVGSGNLKLTIQELFKNTFVISNISKPNKTVLIVSPKFTTIQSRFGSIVKENFDYSKFSDTIPNNLTNSPRNIVKAFLDKNFYLLQNLGHIEVDIISTEKGSTEVKRGLVSPRLLQAIVEWPKDSSVQRLTRTFSKSTHQARTRIKIRKRFNKSKLVLEMLIEAGIMIGTTESQEENLLKAPLERAFLVGRNLSAKIRQDPTIVTNLATSKSLKSYLVESVLSAYSGKNLPEYIKETAIDTKTSITKQKIIINVNKYNKSSTGNKPNISTKLRDRIGQFTSILSLQNLINANLHDQIQKNMGTGGRKDVLNYRTGRFARSAEVTRMTSSRQGAITAFYTYMKNPYATFSEGGQQMYPRSRDPKLLISKSIREIAGARIANRLRAVVV